MIVSAVSSASCSAVTPETAAVKPTNEVDRAVASAASPHVSDSDPAHFATAESRSSSEVQSALTTLAAGE